MDNWGGPWPEDTMFFNNIFHTEEATNWHYGKATGTIFENNLYSGTHLDQPDESTGLSVDGMYREQSWSKMKRSDLERFRPNVDSPLVGMGKILANSGGVDFSGVPLPACEQPTVGAFEPK